MSSCRAQKVVFVGDRRSPTAMRLGVTWYAGRLAAKTLFDALKTLGLSSEEYDVVNAYHDSGRLDVATLRKVKEAQARGWLIIGMGQQAQKALTAFGIPHRPMVHPAARGGIRRREVYQAHVATVLQGVEVGDGHHKAHG